MHVYIDIHFLDLITVCYIFCLLALLFLNMFFSPLNNLFLLATFWQGAWGETYRAKPCQTFCQGMTCTCARASHASCGADIQSTTIAFAD